VPILSERITTVLTPHMGQATAHAVALHVCAKFGVTADAPVSPEDRQRLAEFLRRGLVAYVGAARAGELASACVEEPAAA
jgi:hypothetical protein